MMVFAILWVVPQSAAAFAATAVAFQAANAAEAAWARTLGGAAVMLGVLSSLAAVLYFLAGW